MNVLPITYYIFGQARNPEGKESISNEKRKFSFPKIENKKINWQMLQIYGCFLISFVILYADFYSVRPAWHNETKKPDSLR